MARNASAPAWYRPVTNADYAFGENTVGMNSVLNATQCGINSVSQNAPTCDADLDR